MKKAMKLVVVLGILALAFAPAAMAGTDTDNLSLTADVQASCTIDSVDALAFGTYSGSAITDTGTILVTCVAADATASLGLGDGQNLQAGSPGSRALKFTDTTGPTDHFLTYALKVTDGSGACWGGANVCSSPHTEDVAQDGTQQSFTVWGGVDASQDLYVGNYSDTVVVTVTF